MGIKGEEMTPPARYRGENGERVSNNSCRRKPRYTEKCRKKEEARWSALLLQPEGHRFKSGPRDQKFQQVRTVKVLACFFVFGSRIRPGEEFEKNAFPLRRRVPAVCVTCGTMEMGARRPSHGRTGQTASRNRSDEVTHCTE